MNWINEVNIYYSTQRQQLIFVLLAVRPVDLHVIRAHFPCSNLKANDNTDELTSIVRRPVAKWLSTSHVPARSLPANVEQLASRNHFKRNKHDTINSPAFYFTERLEHLNSSELRLKWRGKLAYVVAVIRDRSLTLKSTTYM